jgi:hypothetical protein
LEASSPTLPSLFLTNKVANISTTSTGGTHRTRSCHATTIGPQIVVETGTVNARSTILSLAHKSTLNTNVQSVMLRQCSGAGQETVTELIDGSACRDKTFSTSKEPWPDPIWKPRADVNVHRRQG